MAKKKKINKNKPINNLITIKKNCNLKLKFNEKQSKNLKLS